MCLKSRFKIHNLDDAITFITAFLVDNDHGFPAMLKKAQETGDEKLKAEAAAISSFCIAFLDLVEDNKGNKGETKNGKAN